MNETITLVAGLGIGLLLGGSFVGLWVAARLRGQSQRAEATVDELRKALNHEREEGAAVRRELAEAQQARVAADTRIAEATQQLADQKALLDQAREELVGSFQALSGEALKHNNDAFLKLAADSFEALQAKAEGDLSQRQQAIDGLVRPLHESLQRYDEQMRLLEQSRQSAYGGLDQHLRFGSADRISACQGQKRRVIW